MQLPQWLGDASALPRAIARRRRHRCRAAHAANLQGPQCAIAAGPAALFRNYFVSHGDGGASGQTAERQLNMLKDVVDELDASELLEVN